VVVGHGVSHPQPEESSGEQLAELRAQGALVVELKRVLSTAFTLLAAFVIGAATSLILLTAALHKVADALSEALDSVRVGQGMELALLTHERA
jgi:hypothetical protein